MYLCTCARIRNTSHNVHFLGTIRVLSRPWRLSMLVLCRGKNLRQGELLWPVGMQSRTHHHHLLELVRTDGLKRRKRIKQGWPITHIWGSLGAYVEHWFAFSVAALHSCYGWWFQLGQLNCETHIEEVIAHSLCWPPQRANVTVAWRLVLWFLDCTILHSSFVIPSYKSSTLLPTEIGPSWANCMKTISPPERTGWRVLSWQMQAGLWRPEGVENTSWPPTATWRHSLGQG